MRSLWLLPWSSQTIPLQPARLPSFRVRKSASQIGLIHATQWGLRAVGQKLSGASKAGFETAVRRRGKRHGPFAIA